MNPASRDWSGASYVALGSSFASAPGLGTPVPGSPPEAGRTDVNYPHLLARQLQLSLTDATSSGATTADVLWRSQYGQAPQADALAADTDLVTVTIGGNDIGFAASLMAAGLPPLARLKHLPSLEMLMALAPAVLNRQLALLPAAMASVGQLIRRRSPNAVVLFVEYLTVLPVDPHIRVAGMKPAQAAACRALAVHLALATEAGANATGCSVVRVAKASADHYAGSADPWTVGAFVPTDGGPLPYHPNQAGHEAVARIIQDHLYRLTGTDSGQPG
ncbi:SGNH/GDSL hydrolase family protein [Arthrobacter gengyunqii]|uniref:SGNH/GDSL hydrolase family protein n=1 Tax=Arthrobacter gengyunqii TaxID=2886940 RepID=A0A9X1M1C6_9MICC|nr:SGNH/GDSL hydrolase family protein [Arthrobacter gengyunqii]MCC3265822.1 SGNH/GDSL hydrolase family protein [Arthrobacter gengyunqii]MCC3268579.1 SGNH/GDSL hydrolase family protein [Arthrobacter gengyunqii]UOY95967.1 SGNH/GDSL hydrolase family protein [Arthrobacter gengyunqii]